MLRHLLIAAVLLGGMRVHAEDVLDARATIMFQGISTLHDFKGRGLTPPFALSIGQDGSAARTWSAAGHIKVRALTTDHRKRDLNMFEMFDSERFPSIAAEVQDATVPLAGRGTARVHVVIGEQSQTLDALVSDWRETDGGVEFLLSFPVSLRAFGLQAPSVLGVIRVGDEVQVNCWVEASVPDAHERK